MSVREQIARIGLPVAAVLASIGIGFAGVTSAQISTTSDASAVPVRIQMRGERPAVVGKVTAISGTSITVAQQRPDETTTTTYTVDASNAKVLKASEGQAPTESTVSAIVVGDMVAIRGTVSGTTVTATEIASGVFVFKHHGGFGKHGTHGTVTAVNGNTITLTGDNGTTYTVDASSAQINKITTINVSDIQIGDKLGVMGEVAGTNVTAKHIMNGAPQKLQQ